MYAASRACLNSVTGSLGLYATRLNSRQAEDDLCWFAGNYDLRLVGKILNFKHIHNQARQFCKNEARILPYSVFNCIAADQRGGGRLLDRRKPLWAEATLRMPHSGSLYCPYVASGGKVVVW
ncbi:hypothetical protein RRG08_008668 [Elysia crispata]|uniref:Uncharacterized protein n=1 Tax=Elysia crispata TaxID=231223 RepID=A0AAE0XYV3_9GAST|nr:hypothetical protein RRG08_008668 [Elysia crispata]